MREHYRDRPSSGNTKELHVLVRVGDVHTRLYQGFKKTSDDHESRLEARRTFQGRSKKEGVQHVFALGDVPLRQAIFHAPDPLLARVIGDAMRSLGLRKEIISDESLIRALFDYEIFRQVMSGISGTASPRKAGRYAEQIVRGLGLDDFTALIEEQRRRLPAIQKELKTYRLSPKDKKSIEERLLFEQFRIICQNFYQAGHSSPSSERRPFPQRNGRLSSKTLPENF